MTEHHDSFVRGEGQPIATNQHIYRDALLLFLGAALVYLLLGQETLYRLDSDYILECMLHGSVKSGHHLLALPLMLGFYKLLGLIYEVPMYRAVTVLSALGTALGIALTYLGCRRLGLDRQRSFLATLLTATALPVVLFATVVEYHGIFFPFAQLGFLICAHLIRTPKTSLAVLLGASAALATLVHASGILLSFLFACWFMVSPENTAAENLRRRIILASTVLAAHVAFLVPILSILRLTGLWIEDSTLRSLTTGFPWEQAKTQALFLPMVIWQECLLPFLPMVAVFLAMPFHPAYRRRFFGIAVGTFPYVVLSILILRNTEYGAYFPPVAVLVATVTVQFVRPWISIFLILASAIASISFVALSDTDGERYREFVAGVHEVAKDETPYVLGVLRYRDAKDPNLGELEAILVADPKIGYTHLTHYARESEERIVPHVHLLGEFVRSKAHGRVVLLPKSTIARLERVEEFPSGPFLLAELRKEFRFEPAHARGFDGFILK